LPSITLWYVSIDACASLRCRRASSIVLLLFAIRSCLAFSTSAAVRSLGVMLFDSAICKLSKALRRSLVWDTTDIVLIAFLASNRRPSALCTLVAAVPYFLTYVQNSGILRSSKYPTRPG
jgi:hypothetical protein